MAFGMRQELRTSLRTELKLAPQLINSIELLQIPSMDLTDKIEQELDENEFLERVQKEEEAPKESAEEDFERYERMDIWDDPQTRRKGSSDERFLNAKQEALQNSEDSGPTLAEHLSIQLSVLDLTPRDLELAEHLIGNLDERGFLSASLAEILEPWADRYDERDAERVLKVIQGLEPKGVGARDVAECLRLQLDEDDPRFALKHALISEHLDELLRNRLPKIARALGISLEELKELIRELAELDPSPARSVASAPNHYLMPDVIVEWNGSDGYDVRLVDDRVPELRLSDSYRVALADRSLPKDYRRYVKDKVESARALISAIEKRQSTLLGVARRIVHYQRDFLDFGPHHLKPLKMQQVADDLGLNVSTISRATSEKYIQTHRGVLAMKSFFTGGTHSVDGEEESRESIKNKIQDLLLREDKRAPLSDDELVEKLETTFGIQVARRTVTKYRKALGILSSRQRREF